MPSFGKGACGGGAMRVLLRTNDLEPRAGSGVDPFAVHVRLLLEEARVLELRQVRMRDGRRKHVILLAHLERE